MKRLLIAGAGTAALACVKQLSRLKHGFSITVVRGPGSSQEPRLARLDVDFRPTVCIEGIDRYAKVVRGCDGSRTTFDTMILAAGEANAELGRAAGLEVGSGVVTNDVLQTSDAHIYALGDGEEDRAGVLASHAAGYRGDLVAGLQPAAGYQPAPLITQLYDALQASYAESDRRSEDQTPEREDRPVLAGAA